MSTLQAEKSSWLSSKRQLVAVGGCVLGLGLIFLGFRAVSTSEEDQNSGKEKIAAAKPKKPVRAWNIALGDVVVLAQELGFSVNGAQEPAEPASKIAGRIESQLQSLRELYRQESEKNPTLLGALMLQFTVAASGEVSQVKEVASRIKDSEFKKAVISEVAHWSFQEVVSNEVTVNCPLLFVREGMDITTLVQWERALGPSADKSSVARNNGNGNHVQEAKAPAPLKTVANGNRGGGGETPKSEKRAAAKPLPALYQVKYATSVRKEPSFASPAVAKFAIGTKVLLINRQGDWLEVRAEGGEVSGFIRKEFVTPMELARKQ